MTDLHALIGRTLGGRYRIEALIGRGGFGEVYRAVHIELDRPVAIKTLFAREGIAAQMQARFRREARVQAELRHPSIVHLLDFGREPDDTCYMVSEYVDGRTLKDTVDAEGPLTPQRAARIVCDVLDGLAAAHRRGIVHRDIKPANIMLVDGPEGEEVRLLDFGIAKVRDAVDESQTLTAQGQLLGTPAFMAPEQIQQEPPSPATDLYAMGGVLYYLLSGQKPFSGGIQAVLTAHLMRPAPTLPPGVGPGFDAVVARAMAKVPAARYASAEAMRGAVAAVAAVAGGTLSVSAPPWTSGALKMSAPAQIVTAPASDEMSATDTWVTPASGVIENELGSTRSAVFVPPVLIEPTPEAAPDAPGRRWQPIAALGLFAAAVALVGLLAPLGQPWDTHGGDAAMWDGFNHIADISIDIGSEQDGTAIADGFNDIDETMERDGSVPPDADPALPALTQQRIAPLVPPSGAAIDPAPEGARTAEAHPASNSSAKPRPEPGTMPALQRSTPKADTLTRNVSNKTSEASGRASRKASGKPVEPSSKASPKSTITPATTPKPDVTAAPPSTAIAPAETAASGCDVRVWQLHVRGHLAACDCADADALIQRMHRCDPSVAQSLASAHDRRCVSTLPGACPKSERQH